MSAVPVAAPAAEFPLAFGQWDVQGDALACRLPRAIVRVRAPQGLLASVLQLCDGRLHWKHVAATLARTWEAAAVEEFLCDLCAQGVLVEAGEALANWSELGQVPGLHVQVATPEELPGLPRLAQARLLPGRGRAATTASTQALARLLAARESVRTFADQPIRASALASLAWAAHGVARRGCASIGWHRTIASGGNMHSLRWFVFVLRELPGDDDAAAIAPGIYEVRFHVHGGASFEQLSGDWQESWRLLGDPRPLQFASALLLPVADVAVPARKYGNRATIFAHVEAGQGLQNAQLMAAALGLGAVVRGDTAAKPALAALSSVLGSGHAAVRPRWLVMPSLVVGPMPHGSQASAAGGAQCFRIGRAACGPMGKAFAFTASMNEPAIVGLGRSTDPATAMRKAEAEAWERLGWRVLGAHVRGRADDVHGPLDPQSFGAHSQQQYATRGFGLRPFSREREYLWRAGVHVASGRTVHLPAECLHPAMALPRWARRQACANATTSGVAAWSDAQGALARATLELLERDAFARAWIARKPASLVALDSLPQDARQRVAHLQGAGFRVEVADIGRGCVPIYAVFLQCPRRPLTAITAAADFDPEAALHKALDEAEGRAAHAADGSAPPLSRASQVRSPLDIHRYYQQPRFFRQADFFADAAPSRAFGSGARACCRDWPELQARLAHHGHALFAFDMTPAGAAIDQGRTPLHVVRAMVTGLVPLWFQYGTHPAGLPAFREAGAQADPADPAFFLHPFT